MKCKHCPRDGFCQGEQVSRLCDLRNPSHPDHTRHREPVMGEDGFGLVLAPTPVEPESQDPTLSLATGLAVLKCPVRGEHLPCGCQVQTNYCGTTFDLMTLRGCAGCVESGTQSTRSALVRETS